MKTDYYEPYAAAEERHWWFAARREILRAVLRRLELPVKAQILEVGCASGGNFAMLAEFGEVSACEYEQSILEVARRRHSDIEIEPGALPAAIPFGDKQFDVIVLLDVLEHIEEDVRSLEGLRERLQPGGWLVITVPAFKWMWSAHDEVNQHCRRYTRDELAERLRAAGLQPVKFSYFNLILMPVILGMRWIADALGRDPAEQLEVPRPLVNGLLKCIFAGERHMVTRWGLPLGVSLLAVARKSTR